MQRESKNNVKQNEDNIYTLFSFKFWINKQTVCMKLEICREEVKLNVKLSSAKVEKIWKKNVRNINCEGSKNRDAFVLLRELV
jgi:predicted transport protein